jgi:hypothetical protein
MGTGATISKRNPIRFGGVLALVIAALALSVEPSFGASRGPGGRGGGSHGSGFRSGGFQGGHPSSPGFRGGHGPGAGVRGGVVHTDRFRGGAFHGGGARGGHPSSPGFRSGHGPGAGVRGGVVHTDRFRGGAFHSGGQRGRGFHDGRLPHGRSVYRHGGYGGHYSGHGHYGGHGYYGGHGHHGHYGWGFGTDIYLGLGPYWWGAPAYGYAPSVVVVEQPPVYVQAQPAHWYYCPSSRAYYPNAQSCSEPWVMVPSQPSR